MAHKGAEKQKTFPQGHVQSCIPIKNIYRGMIITEDDRYVRILEVSPINFSLRSAEEQNNIIYLFSQWLRVAPVKLQFKVITRKADIGKIIDNLREASQYEENAKCRELTEDHIKFIHQLAGKEALSRRYFVVFEYEPSTNRKRTLDEIAEELDRVAQKIKYNLGQCGNECIDPSNEDFFQAEILYQFYNRRTSNEESFAARVRRVVSDTMKIQGLREGIDAYPDIPVVDYIAPRGIDFTHPDYFICDGMYQAILMVKKDGYPTAVYAGWMSTLIEAGDGIDVDIILRKENRTTARERVALKLKLNRIKVSGRSDVDTDYEQIQGAIESAKYIKNCLSSGEDFYHMYTFVTVSAETLELLRRRLEQVDDYLTQNEIDCKQIKLRLEDAFQIVTPILAYKQELMDFSGRNVMSNSAASTYMMSSAEICDDKGIVMGINRRYLSLVNMDIFNTKKYKNANISIIGTSGAGKTYTELVMALRMRMQGIQTFIISPDKAHEFRRASVHIGGSYIRISPGSKNCINIMEIRPVMNPIAEFLDEGDDGEADSWLSQKSEQLLTFFHLLEPDITHEEEQLVDEAIIKTYNRFGITHNNKSVYRKDGTLRTMPIIGDLQSALKEREETRRIANILGRFVTGSAQSFNQQTNVDLTNKFIVFDLQELNGAMKAIGMFVVMDFLWSRIKEDRTERKAVFIDEAWQLIGASSDTRAADFIYRIFKIIRGYGGSAILATQDISDLFSFQDGKFGRAVISNSKTKIILQLEQQEAQVVKEALDLNKNEIRDIVNYERGEALICANNNKVPVLIKASPLEHELITTDPAQLKELVERKKKEAEIHNQMAMEAREKERARINGEAAHDDEPLIKEKVLSNEERASLHRLEEEGIDLSGQSPKGQNIDEAYNDEIEYDAMMSAMAMDQLADAAVSRNPDGSIDHYMEDLPIVPTEQHLPDADTLVLDVPEKGAEKLPPDKKVPEKVASEMPVDPDLDCAEDATGGPYQRKEGRIDYGFHPPADF